jgi:hypothetical protein
MRKWVKDIVKNNRTFRLTFYEDSTIQGMWNCIGEEIYHKKKNIFDLSWKNEIFRFYTCNTNIIQKALKQIDSVLKDETNRGYIIKALDNFVEKGVENDR